MRLKYVLRNFPVFIAAIAAAVIFAVSTAILGEYELAIAEFAAIAAVMLLTVAYYAILRKKKQDLIYRISQDLSFKDGKSGENFPMPVLVSDESGKFIWFNRRFEDTVLLDNPCSKVDDFYSDGAESLANAAASGANIKCGKKYFAVYAEKVSSGQYIFFFADNTKLRLVAEEFLRTRPAVLLIAIDSMEEVRRVYRESDCAAIKNGIEKLIENWLSSYGCLMTKSGESSFIVVAQTGDVEKMVEKKFDILDLVRAYTYNDAPVNITISIGVGAEGGVGSCETQAKQALDMAFGRGGDQAAVKNKDTYDFYGGVSKSVERQTKVRTRIVANAFCDLLEGCDKVMIMGHKYPDLDALGSGLGIAAIARAYGKEAYIVTDIATALSKPLIDYMSENGFSDYIISAEKAMDEWKKKTLLVVTDTHVKNFVECSELLQKSNTTVVIDHHRKSVGYIDDAVIFFHDPSASSASELVTQMIQYLPQKIKIGSVVADALLSGIMLDTKNFVLRSGVATFETAAYLKGAGADTVRVKKLFADNMSAYKERNEIISAAHEYKKCAVSVCKASSPQIRVIAAQAADELLNIKGIDASFVIFKTGGTVNVSARSLGSINVQIIMEKLGGGGHQTMAAAQFKDENEDAVKAKLLSVLDEFLK